MANYPWQSSTVFEYAIPCCACPPDCGNFNITSGVYPYYILGTLAEAQDALDTYGVSCAWLSSPISTDYAYASRTYSVWTGTISLGGGVDSVVDANSASFTGSIYLGLQAGPLVLTGSYSSYCTAGVGVTSLLEVFITGPDAFSEYYSTTGALDWEVSIPAAGCYMVVIQVSTQCECPAAGPGDPPAECTQTAGVAFSATLTMDDMVPAPLSIDYTDGVDTIELLCE